MADESTPAQGTEETKVVPLNPEIPKPVKILNGLFVEQNLAQAIFNYLSARPYQEVVGLINSLSSSRNVNLPVTDESEPARS